MEQGSFYLTTPIYYVNSVPHLGTAYTTIAADALARYRRMTGADVFFLTGLDEHGQKVAQAAEENDTTPQEWCDSIAPRFRETWDLLGVSNDDFIRTTEERHKSGVQAFWTKLHDDGYLYKGSYEGWYCVPCETYYAEDQLAEGDVSELRARRRVHPRGELVLQAFRVHGQAARLLRTESRVRQPRLGATRSCRSSKADSRTCLSHARRSVGECRSRSMRGM